MKHPSAKITVIRNLKENMDGLTVKSMRPIGERKWHIFYLRPRTEKHVYSILINLNYKVFWPVTQTIRIWKNRQRKKVELPLFPNYMFVYIYAYELYPIKCLPHVVTYVTCGRKPSTISDKEIEGIRNMLGHGNSIKVEPAFSKGESVRIISGPLKGHEGILVRQNNKNRFGIQLKSISHTVFIDISLSDLEKL